MSKRNDPNDPQGWFAKISQQALEMPLLPNSRTSAKDPAWKTETGRRVRSALVITKILVITSFSIAVAGLVVGLAVSDPSFRWLVSVAGAVLSALLAVSVGCSGVRTLWLRKIGTTLTVAAIVVALAFIPWLGQSPSILHVGPYQELLGPPGPRLILVVLLLATASLIPPGSFRAGALTVSLAALGTGLAILEGFTWVIGSDPVAWFGSEVGLPPVTATSLALLGPAILLAKPEIPQISAALRAGTSVRVYWATAGWLTLVLVAALGLLRFCLEAGIIWQESVAYSWLFLSVGVGIVLIIQSHKTAQLELLANAVRRELGLLTENASDVVWIAGANGECVWVSRSLTAALGWEPSDWLGHLGSSFVAPEWLDIYHNATQKAEASQQRHTFELQYVNSEGEKIWMSSRIIQERDPDGQLVSVVHSLRIVEEEVKARQALVRSENTLQIALEVSPIGLALLDSQRRIFRTNQAFEEVTGRAAEFVKA